jgi:hypothetical protein
VGSEEEMTLGIQIAVTGALMTVVAGLAVISIGPYPPSRWWITLPILAALFGGVVAFFVGLLWLAWWW